MKARRRKVASRVSKGRSDGATLINGALLRKWRLPGVRPELGKEGRGAVLAVGGSVQNPGAIMLAAIGSLRAGAGKLQIATARSVAGHLAVSVPEARIIGLPQARSGELGTGCGRAIRHEISGCDTLLLGPGMMDERGAASLLAHCRRTSASCVLILDAAALNTLRPGKPLGYAGKVIATPHAGEMAKLLNCDRKAVMDAPLEMARFAAKECGAIVTLKGAETFVVAPDGTAFRNTAGNVGLGTSGSGDALSGVIAGLCARGADPLQAAVWGVYLHAKAGDVLAKKMGQLGFLARELLSEIPLLLNELT